MRGKNFGNGASLRFLSVITKPLLSAVFEFLITLVQNEHIKNLLYTVFRKQEVKILKGKIKFCGKRYLSPATEKLLFKFHAARREHINVFLHFVNAAVQSVNRAG